MPLPAHAIPFRTVPQTLAAYKRQHAAWRFECVRRAALQRKRRLFTAFRLVAALSAEHKRLVTARCALCQAGGLAGAVRSPWGSAGRRGVADCPCLCLDWGLGEEG